MDDRGKQVANMLDALYQQMKEARIDAYLVPSSDAHLNEYVPEYGRRRMAITGFRGSAGDAIICADGNHLFVDSRYYLQADEEVDPDEQPGSSVAVPHDVAHVRRQTGVDQDLHARRGKLRNARLGPSSL